jgi:putative redox protein
MSTIRTAEITHIGAEDFRSTTGTGREIQFGQAAKGYLSPVETILVALGSCTAMDVISIARKKRQRIETYRIHVRGDQRDDYPQVFTEIDVTHEVIGRGISEAAIRRSIELSATKYCPVSAMISAGETVVHHRYRISSSGDSAYESEGEVIATGPFARPEVQAKSAVADRLLGDGHG